MPPTSLVCALLSKYSVLARWQYQIAFLIHDNRLTACFSVLPHWQACSPHWSIRFCGSFPSVVLSVSGKFLSFTMPLSSQPKLSNLSGTATKSTSQTLSRKAARKLMPTETESDSSDHSRSPAATGTRSRNNGELKAVRIVAFDFLTRIYLILQTRTRAASQDDPIMVRALHYFLVTNDIE